MSEQMTDAEAVETDDTVLDETEATEAADTEATDAVDAADTDDSEGDGEDAGKAGRPSKVQRLENEGDIAADYLEELLDIADLDGDLDMDVEGDRASVQLSLIHI